MLNYTYLESLESSLSNKLSYVTFHAYLAVLGAKMYAKESCFFDFLTSAGGLADLEF